MKNVGRIFSIIGGVLALVFSVSLIFSGVFMILMQFDFIKSLYMEFLQMLTDLTSLPFINYSDFLLKGTLVRGILRLVFSIVCVIACIFSFTCHKNKTYIATIVLGTIAYFQFFVVLGAIFGLIFDRKKEEKAE